MNGLKVILYSIIGTFLASALVFWFSSIFIKKQADRPFIQDILKQVEEISKFPQLLKVNQGGVEGILSGTEAQNILSETQIQDILSLIEILESPITQQYVSQIKNGLVPDFKVQPYIDKTMNNIRTAINNEITPLTNQLIPPILAELNNSGNNVYGIIRDNLGLPRVPLV